MELDWSGFSKTDRNRLQKHMEKACNQMVGRALGWDVVNEIFQDRVQRHPRHEAALRAQANRLLRR